MPLSLPMRSPRRGTALAAILASLASVSYGAPAPPCELKCEAGDTDFRLGLSCEGGQMSETVSDVSNFDYGPSGERNVRVTLDRQRTYASSGHTYRIQGWIRNDRTSGKVSYELHVTGGALGPAGLACQAGPAAPIALPAAAPPASLPPAPDVALRVPDGYVSGIVVPECDRARAAGRLPGETWTCFASEKGEYVGQGKLWVLPGASKPVAVSYTAFGRADGRVDVKVKDGDGQWEVTFSPPRGQDWKAGRFETMRDAFQDGPRAGLSVSAHSSACGEETGTLELLELRYDAKTHAITRLAADVEQVCGGKRLRGSVRYVAPAP